MFDSLLNALRAPDIRRRILIVLGLLIRTPATVMTRIARGFSDAEIEALAAYLGGLR